MPKAYKDISASQSARNQLNQSYQASGAAATQQMNANIEELNAMMHGVAEMASQMQDQSKELTNVLQFFK